MSGKHYKKRDAVRCSGGCHCGRVSFSVHIPRVVEVRQCNCSICEKSGFIHLIVESRDLKLISGREDLTEYRFNTGVARHLFCRHCGVKSFYVPRSHPDGFSVNLNCIDLKPGIEVIRRQFDGQHWEDNVASIVSDK